jgi:predicted esterase
MHCALCVLGLAVALSQPKVVGTLADPSYVEVTDVRGYRALVLVPVSATEVVNGKYPTILFLHGIGERGDNLGNLKRNGFPRYLEGDQQFPFIFIMPQCPSSTEWYYTNADNVSAMRMFLDDLIAKYPIDTNRIYITGLSMGGIGTWYFAIKLPTRFAAAVPVSFRGDGWSPGPAKDIPFWAFHGNNDGVIPFARAQELVDQFAAFGGSIRFTAYPTGQHDGSTWTVTYSNPDVYDWMLRKKKPSPATGVEGANLPSQGDVVLGQNYPNPFNPGTRISFRLPSEMHAKLELCNILGQTVRRIFDGDLLAGDHLVQCDASGLPSGIYVCRLTAGDVVRTSKLNLVK